MNTLEVIEAGQEHERNGRFDEAHDLYRNAADRLEAKVIEPQLLTSNRVHTLAVLWLLAGGVPGRSARFSEPELKRALFWAERMLKGGNNHDAISLLWQIRYNLGIRAMADGDDALAMVQFSQALAYCERLGPDTSSDDLIVDRAYLGCRLAEATYRVEGAAPAIEIIHRAIAQLQKCSTARLTDNKHIARLANAYSAAVNMLIDSEARTRLIREGIDAIAPIALIADPDPLIADSAAELSLELSRLALKNPELGIDSIGPARWAVELRRGISKIYGRTEFALQHLAAALYQMGLSLVRNSDYNEAIDAVSEAAELYALADQLDAEPTEIMRVIALITLAELHELADDDLKAIAVAREAAEVAGGMQAGDPSGSSDSWWGSMTSTMIFLLYRSAGVSALVDTAEQEECLATLSEAFGLRETYLVESNRMEEAAEERRDLEAVLDPLGLKLP